MSHSHSLTLTQKKKNVWNLKLNFGGFTDGFGLVENKTKKPHRTIAPA